MSIPSIEPLELKAALESGKRVLLLDVREHDEYSRVKLEGASLFPLQELSSSLPAVRELLAQPHDLCVVYCRSGGRSARAIELLIDAGIAGARNLRGGINAYATEADQSLAPY